MASTQRKIFLFSALFWCGFFASTTNAQALPAPDVFISSKNLVQADSLLVSVKNEAGKISGTLGRVKLHFQKNEDETSQFAIVGMPVNKQPGNYLLSIHVAGKAMVKENISVTKRNFPITELVVTPKLKQQGYTGKKIISTITNNENVALKRALSTFTPNAYYTKPFSHPLSEIFVVGDYGDIRQTGNQKIQHLGVDIRALLNTPVLAINDGKVVLEKKFPDYGNTLIIDHGLGIYSLYLHLSEFSVKTGEMVKQGDIVALSGDTGTLPAHTCIFPSNCEAQALTR